jgi:hypothetical protein
MDRAEREREHEASNTEAFVLREGCASAYLIKSVLVQKCKETTLCDFCIILKAKWYEDRDSRHKLDI